MAAFLLLILCLNIDALSFGVTYGLKKIKFNFFFSLKICIISSIFFAVPLFLSPLVFKYLDRSLCNIINGIILILLSIMYFTKSSGKKKKQIENHSTKNFMYECLAFSVDAIFTAFLGGFPANYYIIFILFYFFTNFLAIYLGNLITYKFNKYIKINLEFFGGIIFLALGIFKIFGI